MRRFALVFPFLAAACGEPVPVQKPEPDPKPKANPEVEPQPAHGMDGPCPAPEALKSALPRDYHERLRGEPVEVAASLLGTTDGNVECSACHSVTQAFSHTNARGHGIR